MNIKDIPRTIEAVRNLPTNIKYRIAMQVGAIPSDKDSVAAFANRPLEEQATAILNGLLAIDQAGGQLPQAPPPAAAQVIRNPDPVQQPQQGYPQQVGAPQQMPPQQLGVPPQHAQQQAAPQQLGAPPMQMPPQQQMAQQPMAQQPQRTPAPVGDPAAASQAAVATNNLLQMAGDIKKVLKVLDEEVPGVGDVQDLHEAVMGLATSVNTLVIIGLLLLERAHDDLLPRNIIYDMIGTELAARTSEQLMGALKGPTQGKG